MNQLNMRTKRPKSRISSAKPKEYFIKQDCFQNIKNFEKSRISFKIKKLAKHSNTVNNSPKYEEKQSLSPHGKISGLRSVGSVSTDDHFHCFFTKTYHNHNRNESRLSDAEYLNPPRERFSLPASRASLSIKRSISAVNSNEKLLVATKCSQLNKFKCHKKKDEGNRFQDYTKMKISNDAEKNIIALITHIKPFGRSKSKVKSVKPEVVNVHVAGKARRFKDKNPKNWSFRSYF